MSEIFPEVQNWIPEAKNWLQWAQIVLREAQVFLFINPTLTLRTTIVINGFLIKSNGYSEAGKN